ncbi:MAG: SIR2 family protein [Deltaproteobacteria bacterium]|nr:SIR2 family protein [Deltaproteobacteria bacterium]
MNLQGRIFVVHGDVSRLCVDAIVVPTSTQLAGKGGVATAVKARWVEYAQWYRGLGSLELEQSVWFKLDGGRGQPAGIVTTCVTGAATLAPRAALATALSATRGALRTAREHLPGDYCAVAVPGFLTGEGGHDTRPAAVVRAQMAGALEAIEEAQSEGVVLDVTFVAFTPQLARIYRQVRREAQPARPPIDPTLATALQRRGCALVVGAGMSLQSGFPTWDGLLNAMDAGQAATPVERADSIPGGRTKITEVIQRIFVTEAAARLPTAAHYLLASLSGRLLLTTNYDELLEQALRAQNRPHAKIARAEDVKSIASHWSTSVVKLHGDATSPGDVVLTSKDYDEFDSKRAAMSLVLEEALLTHTLLFVGYGLGDADFHGLSQRVSNRLKTVKQDGYAVLFADEQKQKEMDLHSGHEIRTLTLPSEKDPKHKSAQMLRFLDDLSESVQTDPLHLLGRDEEEIKLPESLAAMADSLRSAADAAAKISIQNPSEARTLLAIIDLAAKLGWRPAAPDRLSRVYADIANALPEPSFERDRCRAFAESHLPRSSLPSSGAIPLS